MKFFHFSFSVFALMASVSITSCGTESPDAPRDPEQIKTPVTPVTPNKEEAMSPSKQKAYLENVGITLMEKTPASDFQSMADLGDYATHTYGEKYDWDAVGEWGKKLWDASLQQLAPSTKTETENYAGRSYIQRYIYTNYKALILASNFTGHFTARNGKWEIEKASDLQFNFRDQTGRDCVIKLTTSGKVKPVYALNMDDWQKHDYPNEYTSNYYIDRTHYTIGVPEQVELTLWQGGSQVVKATVKVDLGSITDENFDISKNSLTVASTVVLSNGYKVDVSQVAYTANSKLAVQMAVTKNGESLLSTAIASDISGIPSYNVEAFSSEEIDFNKGKWDKANAQQAFVKLDILGKVQIQGTIADVKKVADYIKRAEDDNRNEANFKSYINQANDLLNVHLFYDGKAKKQASIAFEAFTNESWDGRIHWKYEPVMQFYDGSSYSSFEAFFNESDFQTLLDAFEKVNRRYTNLLEEVL